MLTSGINLSIESCIEFEIETGIEFGLNLRLSRNKQN